MIPDHSYEAPEEVLILISGCGAEIQKLYAEGKAWLEGSNQAGEVLQIMLWVSIIGSSQNRYGKQLKNLHQIYDCAGISSPMLKYPVGQVGQKLLVPCRYPARCLAFSNAGHTSG